MCYEHVGECDCTANNAGSSRRKTAFVFVLEKDDDGEEDNSLSEVLVVSVTTAAS